LFFILFRLFLVLAIFFFLVYFLIVVIVPENHTFIQERLGRYYRTLSPGIYFKIPIVDRISYKLSKKEQSLSIKNLKCESSDGVEFLIDSIFVFQVQDPFKAVYETEDYTESILLEVKSHVITEIHNHYSDEIFARRYGMNQSVVKHIGERAKNWGMKIIRFEIQEIKRETKIT